MARGFLPYKLRFSLECVAVDPPHRISSRASGDFVGSAEWILAETEGGTTAELDWRPRVTKAGVRHLTPVLRPLFRANHDWSMQRGERQIAAYLRSRS